MSGRTIRNGYGKAHKRLRAAYAARMRDGEMFFCWRCGRLTNPLYPWDLGYDDADRSLYRGPEHVACNRKGHPPGAPSTPEGEAPQRLALAALAA